MLLTMHMVDNNQSSEVCVSAGCDRLFGTNLANTWSRMIWRIYEVLFCRLVSLSSDWMSSNSSAHLRSNDGITWSVSVGNEGLEVHGLSHWFRTCALLLVGTAVWVTGLECIKGSRPGTASGVLHLFLFLSTFARSITSMLNDAIISKCSSNSTSGIRTRSAFKYPCRWRSKNVNFTPNANSLVACRGSERVVGDGEGLSTLKTRGEIYPTCNQELENVWT